MSKKCRIWITQCLLSYSMLFLLMNVQLQAHPPFFFWPYHLQDSSSVAGI